jgi:hypothetical protein
MPLVGRAPANPEVEKQAVSVVHDRLRIVEAHLKDKKTLSGG